jgi:hypothetical protein
VGMCWEARQRPVAGWTRDSVTEPDQASSLAAVPYLGAMNQPERPDHASVRVTTSKARRSGCFGSQTIGGT